MTPSRTIAEDAFRIARVGLAAVLFTLLSACDFGGFKVVVPSRDVYFLIDVSKSFATYSERSLKRLRGVLFSLKPGDRITIGKIQNCSFSDESILLPPTDLSDDEPTANQQKAKLGLDIKALEGTLVPTQHTDIRGALVMATEFLQASRKMHKVLVIFSDLRDDPQPGCATTADTLINLAGTIVVFADVSISKPDESNAAGRAERIGAWEALVRSRGAISVKHTRGVEPVKIILDDLEFSDGR
jgi:hypothetical protein